MATPQHNAHFFKAIADGYLVEERWPDGSRTPATIATLQDYPEGTYNIPTVSIEAREGAPKVAKYMSKFEKQVFFLYAQQYTYEEISEMINDRALERDEEDGSFYAEEKATVNIKAIDNALEILVD